MLLSIAAAAAMGAAAPLPPLKVQGMDLVDPNGKKAVLRGCNLGNWLVLEMWMLDLAGGQGSPKDQYDLENTLAARFGEDKKDELMEAYRDSWIRQRDFDIIKSFRFNLVRLPVNYRLFESDSSPMKLKPNAFKWVDRAVDMAEKNGMYVILDMHGAQGGQSVYDHTGRSGQNRLWTSEENKARLAWLWEQLAGRYRRRSAVVAYDVFNEPYGGTHDQQKEVFSRVYTSIRKADPDKLILAHGHYDGFAHYGSPASNGWTNVGYQLHFYPGLFGNGNPTIRTHVRHLDSLAGVQAQVKEFNAPFLVGEMNVVFGRAGGASMMRRTYDLHESYGWMTTMWSYKVLGRKGGIGDDHWGMATNAKPLGSINFQKDSYDHILSWFKTLGTMDLAVNDRLRDAMAPLKVELPPLPEEPPARTAAPQGELEGWKALDLGGALKGGLEDLGGGKFALYGGGADMWGARDEGRLLSRSIEGDFDIRIKVEGVEDLEQYTKAGLMVRASESPDSPSFMLNTFPGGGVQAAVRNAAGRDIEGTDTEDADLPLWLRIARKGAKLTAWSSSDGVKWTQAVSRDVPALSGKVLVGPLALSHSAGSLARIVYSGLSLKS